LASSLSVPENDSYAAKHATLVSLHQRGHDIFSPPAFLFKDKRAQSFAIRARDTIRRVFR
jgi:hypothetical protein